MKISRYLPVFCLLIAALAVNGQKGILKQANKYFEAQKYEDALELYVQFGDLSERNVDMYRRGVSRYYTNNIDDALRDFSSARNAGFEEKEIYWYAGKALQKKGQYKDAAQFFKNYLKFADNKIKRERAVEEIKRCNFGFNNQFNEQLAFVENLGDAVNTKYSETHPIQSPSNQNKYYFSSNREGANGGLRNNKGLKDEIYGHYSADMFAVELNDGNWTAVSAFHPILNGPQNDLIQGFNPDGSVMYFIQTMNNDKGVIYADTFAVEKDPNVLPKTFDSPLIAELGDKDLYVFNNQMILFSSKREGGYGGYDIYLSNRNEEGEWQTPVNLGPTINSSYDEVSPYLVKSGTALYFSSDRTESFGGFDVYRANYDLYSSSWKPSENVGLPINSANDDLSFSISHDGNTAMLSSDRMDSFGEFDLYLAYFKDQVVEQLLYTDVAPFLVQDTLGVIAVDSNTQDKVVKEVIKFKEYISEPLYYSSDEIIVTPGNTTKLDRIKDLMTVYPDIEVVLNCHSVQEGMREFDLYFSIKRAEKAAEYLMKKGISASRITVRGLGNNYPHTKATASRLAEKNNRRIDVSFKKVPTNRLGIEREMPVVSDSFKEDDSMAFYESLKGLSYTIMIAATKQMYKGEAVRKYDFAFVEKDMTTTDYIYYIGLYENYADAKLMKGELIRLGNLDASIIPQLNEEKLSKEDIEVLQDVYPDLTEFLTFEK